MELAYGAAPYAKYQPMKVSTCKFSQHLNSGWRNHTKAVVPILFQALVSLFAGPFADSSGAASNHRHLPRQIVQIFRLVRQNAKSLSEERSQGPTVGDEAIEARIF